LTFQSLQGMTNPSLFSYEDYTSGSDEAELERAAKLLGQQVPLGDVLVSYEDDANELGISA